MDTNKKGNVQRKGMRFLILKKIAEDNYVRNEDTGTM